MKAMAAATGGVADFVKDGSRRRRLQAAGEGDEEKKCK